MKRERIRSSWRVAASLLCCVPCAGLCAPRANAASLTAIASFDSNTGNHPYGAVVFDNVVGTPSALYTTTTGGAGDCYEHYGCGSVVQPPGLYWYHPHIYKVNEAAVQGGASGAIIVEGIEKLQPKVAGLPERVLIVRDQHRASGSTDSRAPAWDVSVNYVPVPYPNYPPAVIRMRPDEMEFWRVANAAADTILDIALQYDGVAQPLEVVALDGVPLDFAGWPTARAYNNPHPHPYPAGRAGGIHRDRAAGDGSQCRLCDPKGRYRAGRRQRSGTAAGGDLANRKQRLGTDHADSSGPAGSSAVRRARQQSRDGPSETLFLRDQLPFALLHYSRRG